MWAPKTIKGLRKVYDDILRTGERAYLRAYGNNGETVDFYERLVLPVTWHITRKRRALVGPRCLNKPANERLGADDQPKRARTLSLGADDGSVGDRIVRAC